MGLGRIDGPQPAGRRAAAGRPADRLFLDEVEVKRKRSRVSPMPDLGLLTSREALLAGLGELPTHVTPSESTAGQV